MKKTIRIFVAGAKDLKEQRDKIKALANDLGVDYQHLGIKFDIRSYENFGDDQNTYDRFIEHEADIAIFILDGCIGARTENELVLAAQCMNARQHPEIMVFVRKPNGDDEQIARIEGLMHGALDRYYIEYNDDRQLIMLLKDRLRRYITKVRKSRFNSLRTFFARNKKFIFTTVILIAALAASWVYFANRTQTPLLVCGGGSTAQFIEHQLGHEIQALPDVYYVRMPSMNSWAIIKDALAYASEDEKYYPICISATQATEENFSSIGQKNNPRPATVVSECIGHDTLDVYIRNTPVLTSQLSHLNGNNPHITVSELNRLLTQKADHINIFTTSDESGTFTTYTSVLANADSTISLRKIPHKQFFENTDILTINDNERPYLILAARNYRPQALTNDLIEHKCLLLPLVDERDNKFVTKPHYIYIVANSAEKPDMRKISPLAVDFLRRLVPNTDKKIRNCRIKVRTTKALVPLDSLIDWN